MKITRQILVEKIKNYLNHQLSLDELIDWAENGLMEADLPASVVSTLNFRNFCGSIFKAVMAQFLATNPK